MNIQTKVKKYLNMLETKKRDDGTSFISLKDNAEEKLRDSVYQAHKGKLPEDWVFNTYRCILGQISEYDIKTLDALDEARNEIVDELVDIYISGLTEWLNSDIRNVDYLTQALEEFREIEDGSKLLAVAQYMAIDEIFSEVLSLLES